MKCDKFRSVVFEFVQGELNEAQKAEAALHIEECSDCKKEYESVAELADVLETLGDESAPESLLPNVMNAVSAKKPVRRAFIYRCAAAAAAAVVLVAGAVNVLPDLVKRHGIPENNGAGEAVQTVEDDFEAGGIDDGAVSEASAGMEDNAPVYDGEQRTAGESPARAVVTDTTAGNDEQNRKIGTNTDKSPEPLTDRPTTFSADSGNGSGDTAPTVQIPVASDAAVGPAVDEAAAENDVKNAVDDEKVPADTDADGIALTSGSGSMVRMGTSQDVDAENDGDTDAESAFLQDESEKSGESKEKNTVFAEYGFESDGGGRGGSSGGSGERFICRHITFIVEPEFAWAADQVETAGRSMAEVISALDALGIGYGVEVDDEDLTDEYREAAPERRAEIESLCGMEQCVIKVR